MPPTVKRGLWYPSTSKLELGLITTACVLGLSFWRVSATKLLLLAKKYRNTGSVNEATLGASPGFCSAGFYESYTGIYVYKDTFSTIMENQIEKKMEDEAETGIMCGLISGSSGWII